VTETLPTCEEAALELRRRDFWPVAIHPGAKNPIGAAWGAKQKTEQELRRLFRSNPGAGVGLCLGPYRAPAGRWFMDLEGDGPQAAESLKCLLGGDVATMGHDSTRGAHNFFVADTPDAERLLALLVEAKAEALKGEGKAGVYKLAELPDLEIRVGGFKPGGIAKQCQSVVPPTQGDNGKPREWHPGPMEPAELPEAAYAFIRQIAEQKRCEARANHAAGNGAIVSPSLATRASAPSGFVRKASDGASVEDRVIAYLATCEPAIEGQRGSDKTFGVVCRAGPGFDLQPDAALRLITSHYNPRCVPEWSEAELRHKIDDAYANETRRGWLLADKPNGVHGSHGGGQTGPAAASVNEALDDPHRLARLHSEKHKHKGESTLRFYRGEWLKWVEGAYRPITESELKAGINQTIKDEFDRLNRIAVKLWRDAGGKNKSGNDVEAPEARKVTRNLVADVTQALQSITILPGTVEAPSWIDGRGPFAPMMTLPARNALVSLPGVAGLLPTVRITGKPIDPSKAVVTPTPRFFSTHAIDFDFDLDAVVPIEWLRFLGSLWGADGESIDALQQWFGYCLTPDTRQQKILGLIGPKRAGKDTIARTLTALVGPENTAGPTLASLSGDFGLAPLIGRPLAIVSDARISKKSDAATIVERLLTISGEGRVTIDRKFIEAWCGKLPTRFMLISNELPQLADSSGALAGRMILLRLTKSFYGKEDLTLFDRLIPELPGILLWALDGWRQLQAKGRFVQPKSGLDLLESLEELSSPMTAFIRDCCNIDPRSEVETKVLFEKWVEWCGQNGQKRPGTTQWFARDLRAACPEVSTYRTDRNGRDQRFYSGIELKQAF
jgi:putative DNA primase/helicase